MAAALIPAPAPRLPHLLRLPAEAAAATACEEVRYALGDCLLQGAVTLDAGSWLLSVDELRGIQGLLEPHGLELATVLGERAETLVAAAALGLGAEEPGAAAAGADTTATPPADGLQIHRGTLRSGDHLQSEGSVLLLGDLNPGARISAAGHVLVWGRLRGVAHAGCRGERSARIVALQLRPLQLRIADAVARGPEEAPPPGQAEQAHLVGGEIRIDPAEPIWPLEERRRS
ncbi:MAG: septum site-determining protein MinC [Cyanobium sp.]